VEVAGILLLWVHWKASFKSEKDVPVYVLICLNNTSFLVSTLQEVAKEDGHILLITTYKAIDPQETTVMGLSQNFASPIKSKILFPVRMPVLIGKISLFLSRRMGVGYQMGV
jgi:hypothetical protein